MRLSKPRMFLIVLLGLCCTVAAQQRPAIAPEMPMPLPLLQVRDAEQPIELEALSVSTEVSGSLAQTTVDLTFRNPNARLLEGELQFPLQPGQQVVAFALDIDGAMRSAVPVPKAKGREVFEAIVRRQVDPALLEKTVGNHFKLRVYPIPARGTRQVRLTYIETLPHDGREARLDLPVQLARRVETFQLDVKVDSSRAAPRVEGAYDDLRFIRRDGHHIARIARNAFHPATPLRLRLRAPEQPQVVLQTFAGERYFHAEVPMIQTRVPRLLPNVVGLLWDASLSGARRDHASELALLGRYFQAVGDAEVRLIVLRDRPGETTTHRVHGGDWGTLQSELQAMVYDGASALADWQPEPGIDEYLLVSDGLLNYGPRQVPRLGAAQRLFTLDSSGASGDSDWLRGIAQARHGRAIRWEGSAGVAAAARALLEDGVRVLGVDGDGVHDLVLESMDVENGLLRMAGRLSAPVATVAIRTLLDGREERLVVPVVAQAPASEMAARLWAGYRLRELELDPEANRATIGRLGQQFGIPTSETSLLVLDAVADYVRYDIAPPTELHDEYTRLQQRAQRERESTRALRIDLVAGEFAQRIAWWEASWPKDLPPVQQSVAVASETDAAALPPPPPPSPPALARRAATAPAPAVSEQATLDRVQVTGSRLRAEDTDVHDSPDAPGEGIRIAVQPWEPDSAYARRLREADADRVYALYLDERGGYEASTAFYLDVADILLQKGKRELGLRVLSNLAELDLENRHVLRVLGYRLLQADAPDLALPVFRKVRELSEEEPQSFRDLGLAYAANGLDQAAIDALYEVVVRQWDGRFNGIALIAVGEINAIIARSSAPLDTSRLDRRLLRNLTLDLRVVLTWDSDNSDMDLWVTDPNGEKCYYGHKLTRQGGLMSNDFTGGYGPEEFVLRDARPGIYRVEANFFGDRQQLVTGATTLQLQLITGFGMPRQREQRVTLRLNDARETVLVGEFEVE